MIIPLYTSCHIHSGFGRLKDSRPLPNAVHSEAYFSANVSRRGIWIDDTFSGPVTNPMTLLC